MVNTDWLIHWFFKGQILTKLNINLNLSVAVIIFSTKMQVPMTKCNKTKGDRQTNLTTQEAFKNKPENKQDKTSQTVTKKLNNQ